MAKKVRKTDYNVPYMVQKDEKTGKVTNPIKKGGPYMSEAPNRRERRYMSFQYGGRQEKPIGLIVYKNGKDRGVIQVIKVSTVEKMKDPRDKRKTIEVEKVSEKRVYHRLNADGYVRKQAESDENSVN